MTGGQPKLFCVRGHPRTPGVPCKLCTQIRYREKRLLADPKYTPRSLTRGPSVWTEECLTERWAEYQARRKLERKGS